ncbi:MAG: di-trans,poly-cis-decaprenylcistransferase [Candidatus Eremiobacteraeota bacterium]|nr:di-trans,poly-cis-decaprenylcistransferase [Candidatus Eremiobacteraeota bacterium]
MDGNRRWARERNLPSIEGHRVGARVLREVAQSAGRLGIEILTVFAFSEENWKRAPSEVALLMALMADFASSERDALAAAGIRVRVIGRADRLPDATARALDELVAATAGNTGVLLNLAIDYGARTELSDAMRALATDVRNGRLALEAIDDDTLSRYLYTAGLPDPDLLIRTGGELRLSNFLLYQIAYTELWSTPNHWPSFDAHALADAVGAFANRQRRFGS